MDNSAETAPLLNNYKLEYFQKRLPQTILGGAIIKLGSGQVNFPLYIHVYQFFLFMLPMLLAAIFTVIAETNVSLNYWISIAFGCVMMMIMIIIHLVMRTASKKLMSLGDTFEEDETECEFEGCCGISSIARFIILQKKYALNIFLHGLCYGITSGVVFLYLLPSSANRIFSNNAASIVCFVFGWLTACIGFYGLLARSPVEPAQFRTTDHFELQPLTRAFYLDCFSVIGILAMFFKELQQVDYVARIIFPCLPIIWTLGMLPPVDCLFAWLGEQVLIHLFGGSAMANDLRLLVMLTISIVCWLTVYAINVIPNSVVAMGVAASFGLLLSTDVCTILGAMLSKMLGKTKSKRNAEIVATCSIFKTLHSILMLISTATIACLIEAALTDKSKLELLDILGYVVISLFVIERSTGTAQSLYCVFGLITNPVYFLLTKGKGRKILSLFRKTLVNSVAPLVLVAFMALAAKSSRISTLPNLLIALAASRAYRTAWQDQHRCLLDVSITMLIKYSSSGSITWWTNLGIHLQLLIIALIRNRVQVTLNLAALLLRYSSKFYFSRKVRHQSYKIVAVIGAVGFPIFVFFFGISGALYAPVLPLFTLPIFLVGFPRPLRFWPYADSKVSSSSSDSVYYKQLAAPLTKHLKDTISSGSLGEVSPGDHFLARFQDRLIWLVIAEKGFMHTNVIIKGLELAETSCHTVEAGRIDDIFEVILGDKPRPVMNPYPGHVLTPKELIELDTYSDAKNVLTGVIDSPENLRNLSKHFHKALVWVLIRFSKLRRENGLGNGPTIEEVRKLYESNQNDKSLRKKFPNETRETNVGERSASIEQILHLRKSSSRSQSKSTISENSMTALWSSKVPVSNEPFKMRPLKSGSTDPRSVRTDTTGLPTNDFAPESRIGNRDTTVNQTNYRGPNLVMDDDFDDFGFDDFDEVLPPTMSRQSLADPAANNIDNKSTIDSILDSETSSVFNGVGPGKAVPKRSTLPSLIADVSSPHSTILEPPLRWKESIPVDASDISSLHDQFPEDWFKFVITQMGLETKGERVVESVSADRGLLFIFRKLTLSCFYVMNEQQQQSALDIWRIFTGVLPWSRYGSWLEQDSELQYQVLLAYRYAFKLMYDEAVLGPIDDFEELAEYLLDYEENWHMGNDDDIHWRNAIMCDMPNLLSIGRDKENGTFTSRVLTRQKITVPIGQLDSENVRSIWSSLSLELLYFTNDDEERYSIQAHPAHLRNITIQAADPPLGYPVYSSGLLNIVAW